MAIEAVVLKGQFGDEVDDEIFVEEVDESIESPMELIAKEFLVTRSLSVSLSNLLMTYPKANVIFGVGRIKSKEKCIKTTEIESIRDGILEIPTRLSNYFFVSRIPNHPIWIDILNLALERSKKTIQSQYGIIYTTGPDLVTTAVYNNIHKYNDIVIIPYEGFQKLYVHEAASFNDKNSWRTRTNLPVDESGSNNV